MILTPCVRMFATCSITVGSYGVLDGAGSFFHLMLYRKKVIISRWVIKIKKVELGNGDEYIGFLNHFEFMLTFEICPPQLVVSNSLLPSYLYLVWCYLDLSWSLK